MPIVKEHPVNAVTRTGLKERAIVDTPEILPPKDTFDRRRLNELNRNIEQGSATKRKKAVRILEENMHHLTPQKDDYRYDIAPALKNIARYGTSEGNRETAIERLGDTLRGQEGWAYGKLQKREGAADMLAELLFKSEPATKARVKSELVPLVEPVFKGKGNRADMNLDDVLDVWSRNQNKGNYNAVASSLAILAELNEMAPDAAAKLHQDYGITVFGRYTSESLAHIYKQDKEGIVPKHSGAIVYPLSDHNGAYMENNEMLEKLTLKLGARVYECNSKFGLGKALLKHVGRFGPVDFLLLGAHGNQRGMWFGQDEIPGEWGNKSKKTWNAWTGLLRSDVNNLSHSSSDASIGEVKDRGWDSLFNEGATIMSNSCLVGAPDLPVKTGLHTIDDITASVMGLLSAIPGLTKDSMARLMSGKIGKGIRVLASKKVGGIKDIHWSEADDKLKFKVKFDSKGSHREFIGGKEVNKR